MELTYELVKHGELDIVGVTGMYPQNDNCLNVVVRENIGKKNERKWNCMYCPKPVYKMWKTLNKSNLPSSKLKEIIKTFNDYGEWKYDEASDNASMEMAGESL